MEGERYGFCQILVFEFIVVAHEIEEGLFVADVVIARQVIVEDKMGRRLRYLYTFFFIEICSVLVCFLIYCLFVSLVFLYVIPPIIKVNLIEYFTMHIFSLELHFFTRVAIVHFLDIVL